MSLPLATTQFTPWQLTDKRIWLKAGAIAGLADGAGVDTWSDRSGQGNDVSQATAGYQPLFKTNIVNGKPVVRFDGVDDLLSRADPPTLKFGTGDFSAMLVAIAGANTAAYPIVAAKEDEADPRSGYMLYLTSTEAYAARAAILSGGTEAMTPLSTTLAAWSIVVVVKTATKLEMWINGANYVFVAHSLGSLDKVTPFDIGNHAGAAGRAFAGDIAEILVCGGAWSAAVRQKLDRYAGREYAITVP